MTWLVLLLLVACIIVEAVVVLKTVDITLIGQKRHIFLAKQTPSSKKSGKNLVQK